MSLLPSFRVKSRSGVWYHECLQRAHATRRPLAPRSSGMRAKVVAHRPHRTYVSGNSNSLPYFAWLLVVPFLAGSTSVDPAAGGVEGSDDTAVLDSVGVVVVASGVATGAAAAAGGVSTAATGGVVVVVAGGGVLNNLD